MNPIDVGPLDNLIGQLQSVVEQAARDGSRIGYFGALYTRITLAVRQAIVAGSFDDGVAVARLDVVFASRYLAALEQHRRRDAAISPPWAVAYGAVDRTDLSIVQQIALSVNAHINFDLGLSTFDCFGASKLAAARADFDRVNDVLASVVAEVMSEIGQVSPILRVVSRFSGPLATWLVDLGLIEARAFAWHFATTLAGCEASARPALIDRKAHEVASICGAITQERIRNAAFALIVAAEVKDVPRVIRTLDRGLPPAPGGVGGTNGDRPAGAPDPRAQ